MRRQRNPGRSQAQAELGLPATAKQYRNGRVRSHGNDDRVKAEKKLSISSPMPPPISLRLRMRPSQDRFPGFTFTEFKLNFFSSNLSFTVTLLSANLQRR
jgi:hypothetical protein